MFDPRRPYNDLPLLPPSADIETKAILKRCVAAHISLAELKTAGHLIPDQTVLINTIPVLEARDSSEIENIVTTNDALFRQASEPDDAADPAAKEALRYRTALYHGLQGLQQRPLSTRLATELCRLVKGVDLDIRRTPGTALRNSHTGDVIYTPPEGEARLRDLLANWERFINEANDLDPLVRMAVMHYQFEAIHPFPDGNGRTGRILNILSLIQAGLLDLPTLYMSRHILRTRGDYYRLLEGVTARGAWEEWIIYILTAVEVTSRWTNLKIRAVRGLMDATTTHVQAEAPKIHSRELVELIFRQPYVRIAHVVDRGIAKRQSAAVYLKELARIGVLEETKVGRDKIFLHRRYLDLLSSEEHTFADHAGGKS